jgi:hypothetical protein
MKHLLIIIVILIKHAINAQLVIIYFKLGIYSTIVLRNAPHIAFNAQFITQIA